MEGIQYHLISYFVANGYTGTLSSITHSLCPAFTPAYISNEVQGRAATCIQN